LKVQTGLSSGGRGELLHHCQEQFSVAVIQVGGIPPDLSQKAKFVIGELLRLQLAPQRILGEELREWEFERAAILANVSSEGTVCPFSTLDK
jgi:hypothetical protein